MFPLLLQTIIEGSVLLISLGYHMVKKCRFWTHSCLKSPQQKSKNIMQKKSSQISAVKRKIGKIKKLFKVSEYLLGSIGKPETHTFLCLA